MDVIAPHEAEALANTGYRLEPIEGLGRVLCGGFQQRKLPVTEALIVRGDERQVHRDGLLYGRGMKALSDTRPVRLGSAVLADCGQVGWRVGMLHEISVLNVCASEACDAARGHGCPASRPASQRLWGACLRAGARPSGVNRSGHLWPGRHGWLSCRGRAPGPRGYPVQRRDRRAHTR